METRSRNYSIGLHTLSSKLSRYYRGPRLNLLTERQRQVFDMYYFGGKTQYQIALELSCCQGTVSVSLRQARAVLACGYSTMYYRRADRQEVSWSLCRENQTALTGTLMDILRMRHRDHQTTTEIAKEVGLTQPQVSTLLTACSMVLAKAA